MSNSLWNLHAKSNPDIDCSDFDTVTEWAADEIESLRQRVKELEGAVEFHRETTRNMAMDFEEELAALKSQHAAQVAGQGEPVAWQIHNQIGHDGKKYTMLTDCKETANAWKNVTPLYTAPTIPEGWVMVPIIPTPEMLQAGRDAYSTIGNAYNEMLAAAPSPEDK